MSTTLPGHRQHTPAGVQCWTPVQPLGLCSGERLPNATIGYQTWGTLNAAADNVIWICHALSGSSDVATWWPQLVGAGRAIDPTRHYIVCANVLGGCYGSAGPQSLAPDGRVWGTRFPRIRIVDMVAQQRRLAEHLGIRRIQCVIGGSMGGFQALEWAAAEPERVASLAVIASSWRQPPQAVALADLQCRLIRNDPKFRGGDYPADDPPVEGLSLARQLGHLSYRTAEELDQRFGRETRADGRFQVLSYLDRQGEKLVARFDALSYLSLSDALNAYDFCADRGELRVAARRIRQPALVVGIAGDQLYPVSESQRLAAALPAGQYAEVASVCGHDGFLLEGARIGDLIRAHLLPALEPREVCTHA